MQNIQLVNEAREAAQILSPFKTFLAKRFGKKIYLCHEGPEKHEGWTGQLPFYLFWCSVCEHWAKNYPNGFPERQRLHCSNCNARYSFVQLRIQLQMVSELFKVAYRIRTMKRDSGTDSGAGSV